MSVKTRQIVALLLAAHAASSVANASQTAEARSLTELRNTVVNLLQALVERGVLTREQAQAMVQNAQEKAAAEATAAAASEQAEAGAVRVPYVPEIVKDEIRKQVSADLAPVVAKTVIEQAKSEQWGVPAALPDWIKRVRLGGDLRVRGQGDSFAQDNPTNVYRDYMAINDAGGITAAGNDGFINTTQDRQRLRARLRLGVEAELGAGWGLGARLATGNFLDPVSTNQTLGNTGARYQTTIDLAYLKWQGSSTTGRHAITAWGGRIPNPWLSTDLVWDYDLTFEGLATNYRLGLSGDTDSPVVFATLGIFPLQEVELANDKWLYGGQLGLDWKLAGGHRARFGVAYYDYQNTVGQRNTLLEGDELDYTAPQYLQRGNTLFNIRLSEDPAAQLFALASDFTLVSVTGSFEWQIAPDYRLGLTADYVQNIGYDEDDVLQRTTLALAARDHGYLAEMSFGTASLARHGGWRAMFGYRYVQRDAVLDAFTDSDFHLGGTDAKGFYIGGEYSFTPQVAVRMRYLSANEIDGPPLGIDVLQLDVNTQF